MFLALIPRITKVVNITSSTNNVNLFTYAGSPAFALSLICQVDANVSSNTVNQAAFSTGTGWKQGTLIYLKNTSNIKGCPSLKRGAPGMPGKGGDAGDGYDDTTFLAGDGSSGGAGKNGTAGGTGGPALMIDNNPSVTFILNNQGSILGGSGGQGGEAGRGGGGGGGGQGYSAPPPENPFPGGGD